MSQPSVFHDVAELALSCVCDQMDSIAADISTYPGCPCLAYVSPGEAAFDNCCHDCGQEGNNGQITVYVQDVFPSDNFPSPGVFINPCKAATWVAQIVVTVARCTPSGDEHGHPPRAEELSANAELLAIDLYAVLQGLTCCLTAQAVGHKGKRRLQIANAGSTTITSQGGCAGVEVRAYVEIGPVCACGSEGS